MDRLDMVLKQSHLDNQVFLVGHLGGYPANGQTITFTGTPQLL